jgi:hypothetical protein
MKISDETSIFSVFRFPDVCYFFLERFFLNFPAFSMYKFFIYTPLHLLMSTVKDICEIVQSSRIHSHLSEARTTVYERSTQKCFSNRTNKIKVPSVCLFLEGERHSMLNSSR